MSLKVIPCAVVGYGYWGPNLARVLSETQGFHLKAICDRSGARLQQAKVRFPSVQVTTHYEDVLEDKSIEAIAIATPVSTHYRLARQGLQKGKHLLVEKPLALSSPEAHELLNLCKQHKKALAVGHTFLYSPPVVKIESMLHRRELGRLYYIDSSRVNLGLFQPDVDVFWDLAPHEISIALLWMRKDPVTVRATGHSFVRTSIAEVGYLAMEFPEGITFHSHLSWLAPVKLRRTVLVGSKSMIVYNDAANDERIKIYRRGVVRNPESFGEFQLTYRFGTVMSPPLHPMEPLQAECFDWYHSIVENRQPKSDATFAVRVIKVLEAAQTSIRLGGKAVFLN